MRTVTWTIILSMWISLLPGRLVQAASLDIGASRSSASMANRGDSWHATWSATTAANDGSGVRANVVQHENGRHDSDGRWRVIRPFLVYTISGLPAGAQVTEASLILRISFRDLPSNGDDDQTYVRVVLARPLDPNNLTASDFGSVEPSTLYSGKHFLHGMTVDEDFVIPLAPTIFEKITNGTTLTLALMNGHELENADHFPGPNIHNHGFSAYAPSSGTPPLLRIVSMIQQPICDIQLNKTSFVNGDKVIAQVARLANPGLNPVPMEVKLWFEVPGSTPVPFLTVGADGSFVLSSGFNTDFGPLDLATVQPTYPRGPYQFNCRLLHAVTGALLAEDSNAFQLQ